MGGLLWAMVGLRGGKSREALWWGSVQSEDSKEELNGVEERRRRGYLVLCGERTIMTAALHLWAAALQGGKIELH